MEQVVAKIRKTGSAELWVVLSDFTGEARLDVREYFQPANNDSFRPTKKGISVPLAEIPELRNAIAALSEVRSIGTVATMRRPNGSQLTAGVREYLGHTYSELRLFVPGTNGELRPTIKGVTFKASLVPTIVTQ
jgi:hypothetical protein